jgi:hypothetical protein
MNATAETYCMAVQSPPQLAKLFAPWKSRVIATSAATQTMIAATNRTIAARPSLPRIHAAASAPHVSAKRATITTWTIQVDIASDCRLAKRVVLEPGVHSTNAVDHLRDAEVNDEARQCEGFGTF